MDNRKELINAISAYDISKIKMFFRPPQVIIIDNRGGKYYLQSEAPDKEITPNELTGFEKTKTLVIISHSQYENHE